MRFERALVIFVCTCCGVVSCSERPNLAIAEQFITAFYSWDAELLADQLAPGAEANQVLYYQGWAQAANYAIAQRRPCVQLAGDNIECAITVTDDFGRTLGYTATDTFALTVTGDKVSKVTFAGDDPPVFEELFAWLAEYRPEVLDGPCRDLFAGGKTPASCARAVVAGAQAFVAGRAD